MKLVGFVGNDFNVDQLEALGATITHHGKAQGNLIVAPYNAYIQFDSYDEARYRPYLQLDAEIRGGRGQFGNGITEFMYREDDRLNRSVRYDFTDRELAILVEKGLYYPEFEVPSMFTDADFEIPMEMDITEVELNDKRLVYASFDMLSDLQTDSERSDYDLVDYFEKQEFEREREMNKEHEMEAEMEENQEMNSYVAETVQEEAEAEVETMIEEAQEVEPVRLHETAMDRFTDVDIDDIMEDEENENDMEAKTGLGMEADVRMEAEPETEKHSAPSQPSIRKHGVRDVADEFDAGKARQMEMNREAVEPANADFMGGLTGGEPDMDQPDM